LVGNCTNRKTGGVEGPGLGGPRARHLHQGREAPTHHGEAKGEHRGGAAQSSHPAVVVGAQRGRGALCKRLASPPTVGACGIGERLVGDPGNAPSTGPATAPNCRCKPPHSPLAFSASSGVRGRGFRANPTVPGDILRQEDWMDGNDGSGPGSIWPCGINACLPCVACLCWLGLCIHDIVITNIVWYMAYKREVEGGSYIAHWACNTVILLPQCGHYRWGGARGTDVICDWLSCYHSFTHSQKR